MEHLTLYGASFLRIILLVFSRFGEGLRIATDRLNSKNFYAFNPSFDKNCVLKNNNASNCRKR